MKRDVMQAAGLELFAEIAFVIFAVTFLAIILKLMLSKKDKFDDVASLPLNEGTEVHS